MNVEELEQLGPDKAAPLAAAPAPAAPAPTRAQEWAQIPAMFGGVLGRWFPALEEVYTPQANEKWGAAFAKVADTHGWTPDAFFAWLWPWVPVALASEALLTPTVLVIRARIAELKAEKAKPEEKKPDEVKP